MSPPHADAPAPRSGTHSLLRLVATLVLLGASLAVAGQARAADLNATPSTLSSVYASAQGGDVIHLAAGSYGNFAGGSKASVVTLVAQPGATATISPNLGSGVSNLRFDGLTIDGVYTNGARNVAFVNSKFTGLVRVDTPANVSAANILFDHDTFDGLSATATSYEGRLTVRGYDNSAPVGVKITNSHFGNGGCSDGVQIIGGAYGVEVGPGNEFSGIQQGACAPHVDSIQLYGSSHTQIVGNYFHDDDTIIMAPDGGESEYIADNVMIGGGYVPAVQLGSHRGSQFVHNTVKNIDVHMDHKSGASPSSGGVVRDNVFVNGSTNASDSGNCSGCTVTSNLFTTSGSASGTNAVVGNPVFVGGANPSSYAGYQLASSSPGRGNASDGNDLGARVSGGSTPPPPTDTTAPDTTITSGPTGTSNDSTPTFAFTATEANSVFECRVDSGAWADCTSPWTTGTLSDGAHSVAVRATDAAGNTDSSPATRSFTVAAAPPADSTAPDTTITSGPTGTSNDSTPTFAFTATEANSVFECQVDSGAWANCTSPWTTGALSDGAHSVAVRATDVAGNTDATPATRSFTVAAGPPPDTTAPDTTITSGPTGTTNDATPTFAFDSSEAGSTFECRVDSAAWGSCTNPWTVSTLADGAHSVAVRATDAAGNTDGSPATRSFTVAGAPPPDTTAPDTTITSGPSGTTSATTASFAFDSSDSGATFECKLDAGAYAACTSPKDYSPVSAGSHTFNVRATDAAGNTDATPATRTWTVQDAPPADHQPVAAFTASPSSPTIGQAVSFDASSATCDDTPCTYTWEDDGPDGTGGRQWPLGEGKTMTFTFQGEGVKYVRLSITDTNDDTDSTMKPITVAASPAPDPTAPDTTITSGPSDTTSSTTPTFAFTSSERASAFECRLDSGAWPTAPARGRPPSWARGRTRCPCARPTRRATPTSRRRPARSPSPRRLRRTPPRPTPRSPRARTGRPTTTRRPSSWPRREPGSIFACQIDVGAAQTCASPWTTPVPRRRQSPGGGQRDRRGGQQRPDGRPRNRSASTPRRRTRRSTRRRPTAPRARRG